MGCGLLSHVHTSENIILLGHSTVGCLLVSLLSVMAERGQGLSGSQQLLAYEILLFFFSEQSLLLRAGMLADDDVVEKYRFQQRNRNLFSGNGTTVFSTSKKKKVKNWEMYKWIQCSGTEKLSETLADLGTVSLFSCKCQDYEGNLQNC